MRDFSIIGDDVYYCGYKVATLEPCGKALPVTIRGTVEHIIRYGPFKSEMERILVEYARNIGNSDGDFNLRLNINLGNGQ